MATKAEKQAAKEEAKAEKAAAKAEAKAEKAAVKEERSELARIAAAQKAEIVALRSEGVKGKALSAEKKANTAEYNNAQDMFSAAGRQTLMTAGQPTFFSNAATYSGQTADNVNQRLQTAASKYDTLGITDLSMAGRTKVGLGLDKIVQYDLGKAGNTATTTIQRAERFVGKAFSPEELKAEGIKVKEVKGVPGLFRYRTGEEGNSIYTFFRKDAEGNFVGTGVNRTATPQDDGGFFQSDLGKALLIAGSIALTFTPGGQAFAGSIGSALSGGSLVAESLAAQALGQATLRGVSTGLITGSVEKGLIAAAVSGAGSALNLSGELGNIFDSVGLGDFKDTFGVIGGQASEASMAAADAASQAAQGLGADQIASNLVAAGVDPTMAQNAASLAIQGASASAITSSLNTQATGGTTLAELGISEEEVPTLQVSDQGVEAPQFTVDRTQTGESLFNLPTGPTGPAGFEGIDLSSQLAGGQNIGQFGSINTGGFAGTIPTTEALTQSLIAAGLAPGTAANLAGATLAGVGGVGSAAAGLLGTGTAAGALGGAAAAGLTASQIANLARAGAGLFGGGAGGGAGGLFPGLGNLNLGGMLGAGIDFAQLEALRREATGLGREIAGEASRIGREAAVPFTPYTVTTGAGVGTVGPGGATAVTSPEMQALRQQQLGLAGQAFGTVNPAQAAEALYQRAETLAAPGRAREQEALLANLQARGLLGIGRNLPTTGGEVRGVNPLFESLLSAQETARAQQALQAQQFGTQEATRQAALGQGLVGGAQQIDQQALAALNAAATLGNQERELARRNAVLQAEAGLRGLELRAPYEQTGLYLTGQALTGLGGATRGLFGLPTQQGNVGGSAGTDLSLNNLLSIFGGGGGSSMFTNPAATGGFGSGYIFGNEDLGQYF
jgi:hypothetical protein